MEFEYLNYDKTQKKIVKNYDLKDLYEHTHSELSLQQNKRDQIISIYLALFSFLLPFVISIDGLAWKFKGLLFIFIGIIGLILSVFHKAIFLED